MQVHEPLVFTRQQMTAAEVVPVAHGSVGVFTTRSPGKETDNEDAAAIVPVNERSAILAVADGLGGHHAGAEAAELALKALVESVQAFGGSEGSLRAAILNGFEHANEQVSAMGVGAATTLAVIELDGSTIRPYHVGDSVILVVGQRGKSRHQTVPHSPVGYAIEAGLLNEAEAIEHADRHIVSNIVGSAQMRIEIGPVVQLRPRDTVLLSSDGLFDNLRVQEIIEVVRKGPLERVMKQLSDQSYGRMTEPKPGQPSKPDDLTFLVYRGWPKGARTAKTK